MNPLIAAVEPSMIREINAQKRPGDLDLGLGEPTLKPDPTVFHRAADWVADHGCRYSPNLGFDELRSEVAVYLGGRPEEVCITHGSQEALYLGLRASLDPASDEALIVEPCYPAYSKICAMEGIRHRTIGLSGATGFAPDAEKVLAALGPATRLVVVNSPSNPTGRVWSEEQLRRLEAGLRCRGCRLLCDEVYRELSYTPELPPSARGLAPDALIAGGLSKSHALTGLRIGWLWASRELMPLIHRCHQLMTTAASTYSQRVAIEVLRQGDTHRQVYRERREMLLEGLARTGLEWAEPEGAFYLMVRLPQGVKSHPFALDLLQHRRVVTVPGVAFGSAAEGWLRVSWAGEPATVREGLLRLDEAVSEGKRYSDRNQPDHTDKGAD